MTDEEYMALTDEFIDVANDKGQYKLGEVSSALMNASARFSIHNMAMDCPNKREFQLSKKKLFHFLVSQYEKMLQYHFNEFNRNFEEFILKSRGDLN